MEEVDVPTGAEAELDTEAVDVAAQQQLFMQGLSRLDRVMDDSGFAFTSIDVVDKALTTIEPIRNYPHLQFVNLANNQLSDVSPLADLTYLVGLNLSENTLTTPPAFANPYLQAIDLSHNQLTTLDGLKSSSLSSVKISDNQIETLTGLSGMSSLVILDASRNIVADLSSLSSETSKLERLELNENKLTSLAGIEALTATLNALSVRQNNLDTMEAIDKLIQLEQLSELDLGLNPVTDTENYRLEMILMLPHLRKLDGELITDAERIAAVELKAQREAAAAEAEQEE
ncbi:hypothetical protein Poli38472_009008 [Pythium oligandrum]|uniref:U2A'/phosphoprotein 32 family A C-terminal domain-containing protein n=1 Tax=Pythium oligandrum TaxID=41045 RepID=A0A8K1CLE1_PYTOL|nr:hypothetical protein Poli38472_009008 [Pythium oligandrum]|eukprot:TMW64841.1 hypothetical protein Poli38472_009008 [Pythium oligandrum]